MRARIRTYSGFQEVEAWPTPCKYIVITKAVSLSGYTLTHTTTGMSFRVRARSRRLLRLYAAVFGAWGVPWESVRTPEKIKAAMRNVPVELLRWRESIAAGPESLPALATRKPSGK